MSPISQTASSILPLIESAYSSSTSITPLPSGLGHPDLPSGLSLVGLIAVDPTVTTAITAVDSSVHVGWLRNLFTPDLVSFGYVAIRDSDHTAIISVRGTETDLEWGADAFSLKVPFALTSQPCRVHEGFQLMYQTIRKSVEGLVSTAIQHGATSWIVTGHSLGGPLAIQSRLAIPGFARSQVYVMTWASPRFGDQAFANWYRSITIGDAIVNEYDIVPKLPPAGFGFADNLPVTRVKGGGSLFDLKTAHNLQLGYQPGIAKL